MHDHSSTASDGCQDWARPVEAKEVFRRTHDGGVRRRAKRIPRRSFSPEEVQVSKPIPLCIAVYLETYRKPTPRGSPSRKHRITTTSYAKYTLARPPRCSLSSNLMVSQPLNILTKTTVFLQSRLFLNNFTGSLWPSSTRPSMAFFGDTKRRPWTSTCLPTTTPHALLWETQRCNTTMMAMPRLPRNSSGSS